MPWTKQLAPAGQKAKIVKNRLAVFFSPFHLLPNLCHPNASTPEEKTKNQHSSKHINPCNRVEIVSQGSNLPNQKHGSRYLGTSEGSSSVRLPALAPREPNAENCGLSEMG